tara:strand:+ start:815 stop:1042 length:228 start_codon:yes stop_codon:yes gene_type:complete
MQDEHKTKVIFRKSMKTLDTAIKTKIAVLKDKIEVMKSSENPQVKLMVAEMNAEVKAYESVVEYTTYGSLVYLRI